MTRAELLKETREVVRDLLVPQAWSDARLLMWLSEGQDKFCTKTGFWSDKTTYKITLVAGQQDYAIPERVIAVRSIWDGNRQLIDAAGLTFSDADFQDTSPQHPVHYRTDLETGLITFFEPVIADIILDLRVHRKSKTALNHSTQGAYDAEPEIPEDFHLALVDYAAAKAFMDHDRELQDPVKSADHKRNFNQYVREGSLAYRRITGEYSDVIPNPNYVV